MSAAAPAPASAAPASAPVTAAAIVAAAAATGPIITIQLLTGDQIKMEFPPKCSYLFLYQRIWNQIPEEFHVCGGLDAMMLLLDGELVPLNATEVTFSRKVYHLLMDPTQYMVSLFAAAAYATDLAASTQNSWDNAYRVLNVVVHSRTSKSDKFAEKHVCRILYNDSTGAYHPFEEMAYEWSYNQYDHEVLNVWIPPDRKPMTAKDIIAHVMDRVESVVQPSLAGKRRIRKLLENAITSQSKQ
jgi:hypothetical protein